MNWKENIFGLQSDWLSQMSFHPTLMHENIVKVFAKRKDIAKYNNFCSLYCCFLFQIMPRIISAIQVCVYLHFTYLCHPWKRIGAMDISFCQ